MENISDIKSTEGLKYYDIDGSEVRITSTPKLETIYIQDSKNKKLFISEDLYNRYISKKEIKRIIDVLEKLAPKEIKITPIEIVSPGFAKIKPIYQEEEQAIKFKSFFPVKEEARKYLEREVEWDKVEDLKVPGYLKDVIDSRKHGLTEHSITVESKYLNEVDLSNKKVIFSEPMDIAIIDVSFWEHNHSNKENKQ
ncbi:MAG: hypothetical protein IJU92_03000 [Spirochaetaceae bacterium]|nr:hypothetical protein [Spirochaetaceae bacterium]